MVASLERGEAVTDLMKYFITSATVFNINMKHCIAISVTNYCYIMLKDVV